MQFKSNPLNNLDNAQTVRQMFIAKIKNLKILNRTAINVRPRFSETFAGNERKGAEIDYLKRFGAEWLQLNTSDSTISAAELEAKKNKFHSEHPRYNELVNSKLFYII